MRGMARLMRRHRRRLYTVLTRMSVTNTPALGLPPVVMLIRRLPKRLRGALPLTLLWLGALTAVTFVAGYHTLVCSSSVRISLRDLPPGGGEEDGQGAAGRNAQAVEAPVVRGQTPVLSNCFQVSNISMYDTWLNHNFRANKVLDDSQIVYGSPHFLPRHDVVNPVQDRYLIQPTLEDVCAAGGTGLAPYVLVMIPSLAEHTKMRDTIRSTWASRDPNAWPGTGDLPPVRVVFVFGRTPLAEEETILAKESRRHGDVLYVDFVDSYRNLTYKSVTSLNWAATRCPRARYFMKVDEDTFVNVPYLLAFLRYHGSSLNRTVLGYAIQRPVTVRTGKWAVSVDAYPLPVFPRYVYGHSYVINADILGELVNRSRHLPSVPVEDAFVTGVLAHSIGATRLHNSLFARLFDGQYECAIVQNARISVTSITDFYHHRLWDAVRSRSCTYEVFYKRTRHAALRTPS